MLLDVAMEREMEVKLNGRRLVPQERDRNRDPRPETAERFNLVLGIEIGKRKSTLSATSNDIMATTMARH